MKGLLSLYGNGTSPVFLFCFVEQLQYCICFCRRLNIPPFVCARDALEGLQLEDEFENGKPVKDEITDTKVKMKRAHFCFPEKLQHFFF